MVFAKEAGVMSHEIPRDLLTKKFKKIAEGHPQISF